jgi:lipoprotein-anchoring transpeptidase ErfK/SrfK
MESRTRDIVIVVAGLAVLLGAALGGYAAVRARAQGSGASQVLAPVTQPTPAPSGSTEADSEPPFQRWTVGKAVGPVTVYTRPSTSAAVKTRLGKVNQNGYPTLVLVDSTKETGGRVWYRVWLAMRPNGSRGWVPEGKLAFYKTSSKITIDLSERTLSVYRRGALLETYPVAVGKPGLSTPTGFYFINQKLKPSAPGGAYGVLAIGISAFQPKLPDWPQGGPVAIHGTNQDELIGKAVSHGCVRMHDKDVLAVSRYVPAGSPVVISK